jgi:predicted metal-dependent hydrolase
MLVADLLEEGILFFNGGRFYEAHEVWEDLWRATVEPGLRTSYQGLIQAAVGLHHLTRRNSIGARSQFQKSIRNLLAGSAIPAGLDVPGLIHQLSALLESMPETVPPGLGIARLK